MHKRLYTLFVLLLLPIFLVACEEHGAGSKVDADTLAATLQRAMDTAETLEAMNLKAYGLATAGGELADVDVAKAREVLEQAAQLVNQSRSGEFLGTLAELRATIADWPAAEQEQIAGALDRIEGATSRVWVVRVVAEGLMKVDRPGAQALLERVAYAASNEPNKKYRDLDLRSTATLMAKMNVASAVNIAAQIDDPRMQSWAYTEIGSIAADSSADTAREVIEMAANAARAIPANVTAESALVTDETSQETRDIVLGAETARINAAAARALSGAALAMNRIDASAASGMFREAASMASGIKEEYPYIRAYAMSDVAMDYAMVNPAGAAEMADAIGSEHKDAKFAVLMKAINAKVASGGGANILTDITKAQSVADAIENEFDRAKALDTLAIATVPYDKAKAVEMAESIERELGEEKYCYSAFKNNVLSVVARATMAEDEEATKAILEPTPEVSIKEHGKHIVTPRFANNDVNYIKGKTYLLMAQDKLGSDNDAAVKLFGKAAGAAGAAKSSQLMWEIAEGMCKINPDNLMDFAAKIEEGDYYNKAMALSSVAANWSAQGNVNAPMVWDMAAKSANMMGDDIESSMLLNRIAVACSAYDRAMAGRIFEMSLAKVNKIGMKEEG